MSTTRRFEQLADGALATTLALWFVATALGQHPHPTFDRIRRLDRLGCGLPNWRFFAPNPAVHDPTVLYRWLGTDESSSEWHALTEVQARQLRQIVWYPERRRDKAIADICSELQALIMQSTETMQRTAAYRLLRNIVEREVRTQTAGSDRRPSGFQFVVMRTTGYDDSDEPAYVFASRFERLSSQQSDAAECDAPP